MKHLTARRVALTVAMLGVVAVGITAVLISFRTSPGEVYQHAQLTGHHAASLESSQTQPTQAGPANTDSDFGALITTATESRPVPALESRPIKIDGRFDDWRDVQPEFRDTIGDQVRRAHRGWNTNDTCRNVTGRNDIVAARTRPPSGNTRSKVSQSKAPRRCRPSVSFSDKTRNWISPPTLAAIFWASLRCARP